MSERIISLTSENIKRLKAVHITPNGASVEIAGRNGAGKSSVLDSIWYALAGRSVLPDRPIRDGESRAEVTVELENYTVTRSFTAAGGGTLKVTPKVADGKPIPSPQSFLDGLLSTLTFDPFEFTRLKDSEQGETLRKLLGLDFSSDDAKRKVCYDKRTELGREESSLRAKLVGRAFDVGLSAAPIVLADVLTARGAAVSRNSAKQLRQQELGRKQDRLKSFDQEIATLKTAVASLKQQLVNVEVKLQAQQSARRDLDDVICREGAELSGIVYEDVAAFDAQVLAAEQHNRRVEENRQVHNIQDAVANAQSAIAALSVEIDVIDLSKVQSLAHAKFPLPGLSFSATGGVAFNGVPFRQISTAEQIRVSTAIGLSLNPGLKVIFIRNGSLIDDAGIRTLCELAKTHEAQIWIERVGALSGELPGVVIEDGAIVESTISQ